MTVTEMHHAVEQGLQKVASASFDTFLPEEIDFALNKMQERFIKQRFWNISDPKGTGLHGSQKRADDLRIVTVLDYNDTVTTANLYADHEDFDLPTDYMFLINARVEILYDDCQVDPELVTNSTFDNADGWSLGTGTDASTYKWAVTSGHLKHSSGSTDPARHSVRVKKGNKYLVTFLLKDAVHNTAGYAGSLTVSLNDAIAGGSNTSSTFSYVANSSNMLQSTSDTVKKQVELECITDWRADSLNNAENNNILRFNPSSDFTGRIDEVSVKRIMEIPVRIVEPDDAYNILGNPFATSTPNSAVGVINGTYIKVFNNKSYLLKGLNADYIRTPAEISLSSNQDCELADHTHQEIVDLTVKHLLEATESQRYQTNAAESSQTE